MDEIPPEIRSHLMKVLGLPTVDAAVTSPIDNALDLMAGLGIARVVFKLDGGGDEGECILDEVVYADGRTEDKLPDVPVGFTPGGQVNSLADLLEGHAADAPEIDWVNNDGGCGTVTYLPLAEDGDRIDVDVHSNPEDEDVYDDEEDDVHFGGEEGEGE